MAMIADKHPLQKVPSPYRPRQIGSEKAEKRSCVRMQKKLTPLRQE
jgi:hypothetical protein